MPEFLFASLTFDDTLQNEVCSWIKDLEYREHVANEFSQKTFLNEVVI